MVRCRNGAVALALLTGVSVLLHGCGGGGKTDAPTASPTPAPIPTPTPGPTPSPPVPRPTPRPTPAPKPKPPGPAKPGNFTALKNIFAIGYNALPPTASAGTINSYKDVAQIGYKNNWDKEGRDDLGTMKRLGANTVKIYQGLGSEWETDHGAFLDRAYELGLHVIAGFQTQGHCPDYNCFQFWKDVTTSALQKGFMKDGKWHPAVGMLVLMDEPDYLNFEGVPPADPNMTAEKKAKLRTVAVLSAIDGVLAAEAAANVDGSGVNLTVAWSFSDNPSVDKSFKSGFMYGFQDVTYGIKHTKALGYKSTTSAKNMEKAFEDRWVHSWNSNSPWEFIKGKVDEAGYGAFAQHPWFLAEWKGANADENLELDLKAMDTESLAPGSSFMGVALYGFMRDYDTPDGTDFMYSLGKDTIQGELNPCREDVRTKAKDCGKFPTMCITTTESKDKRADTFAKVFGGTTIGAGQCADGSATSVDEMVEKVVVV